MSRRKFGITLLSTPIYYLFSEEKLKSIYYNLIKYIKYKYGSSNYDYSIFVGMSNVNGKTVFAKTKTNEVGRPKVVFIPLNKKKGIEYVNWHLHVMVCGAPLGTMVKDIEDYLQRILNDKIYKDEIDKKVYKTQNFRKCYYGKGYKRERDLLLSGLTKRKLNKKARIPKCSLSNLNVNRRKTRNGKQDYENVMAYIKRQSILTELIESDGFTLAYFDIAKELNLLAKEGQHFTYKPTKYKDFR